MPEKFSGRSIGLFGPIRALDWQLIRKDGSRCAAEIVASLITDTEDTPQGFRGVARDVSHRKAMEASLRQSQKMESIGTLAAGIAHYFNNVLYIIVGNADLAIEEIPKHAPVRSHLQQIKAASVRAAGVVRQLLNFSRDTEQKLIPLDLCEIIREELAFLRSSFPSFIDIILQPKKWGKGSGMGLAVVHGIVKNLRGRIEVSNVHGEGARFKVLIPCTSEIPAGNQNIRSKGRLPKGHESILFVDALDKDWAKSIGASGFLLKPIAIETLAALIRNILDPV